SVVRRAVGELDAGTHVQLPREAVVVGLDRLEDAALDLALVRHAHEVVVDHHHVLALGRGRLHHRQDRVDALGHRGSHDRQGAARLDLLARGRRGGRRARRRGGRRTARGGRRRSTGRGGGGGADGRGGGVAVVVVAAAGRGNEKKGRSRNRAENLALHVLP